MTPEQEVLTDLLTQLDRIAKSVTDDCEVLGGAPQTLVEFENMPMLARTATKALLKDFEQYTDTLQRVIRSELRVTGVRLKGMTPLDVANKAEELDQVADGPRFLKLVKLRNELAHEYPDNPETQFLRFSQTLAGLPFLHDVASRVRAFAATRLTGVWP